MARSCIICKAVDSPTLQLQYCDACQSAVYCSRACQRIDWKKQHKQICTLLNVGHGDMQVRDDIHTDRSNALKGTFEISESRLADNVKRFFKLFQESTKDGSRAAAKKMKKFAKGQPRHYQKFLLFHSLYFLVRSDSEMLSWPNSPLLVLLQSVDPNVLYGDEETTATPLHHLADMADPFDYSTHVNQLILAKQLIDRGANVNSKSIPQGETLLHKVCFSGNVTNLDVVELLLKEGADPNAQDESGKTPLMYAIPHAPGAAKCLLKWSTTDADITDRSGASFPANLRSLIIDLSNDLAYPGHNPERVQTQFLLQQWRDIEAVLVERGP